MVRNISDLSFMGFEKKQRLADGRCRHWGRSLGVRFLWAGVVLPA
jgi:hypothetical protein